MVYDFLRLLVYLAWTVVHDNDDDDDDDVQEGDLLCGNLRRHTVLTKVDSEILFLHRQVSI
jgi:hypothetical protein